MPKVRLSRSATPKPKPPKKEKKGKQKETQNHEQNVSVNVGGGGGGGGGDGGYQPPKIVQLSDSYQPIGQSYTNSNNALDIMEMNREAHHANLTERRRMANSMFYQNMAATGLRATAMLAPLIAPTAAHVSRHLWGAVQDPQVHAFGRSVAAGVGEGVAAVRARFDGRVPNLSGHGPARADGLHFGGVHAPRPEGPMGTSQWIEMHDIRVPRAEAPPRPRGVDVLSGGYLGPNGQRDDSERQGPPPTLRNWPPLTADVWPSARSGRN